MSQEISSHSSTFKDLKLKNWLVKQCLALGLKCPSPVQAHCIPEILSGRDCIGCAKTGSGKTLAFALPILHGLSDDPYGIYALVLTPTRELALQIADQFRFVGKPLGLRDCVVIGGRDMILQAKDLAAKPHIVIATPGRLADHLTTCDTFTLKRIKFLVLDEADRLMDGSFDEQLMNIFHALPPKSARQTLLFSATLSDSLKTMRKLAAGENREPFVWEDVSSNNTATVEQLDQRYLMTPVAAKDAFLVQVIQAHFEKECNQKDLVMVFTHSCRSCQLLSMTLNTLGFSSTALHSMISQRQRIDALSMFRSARVRILVATDLASRGLDIPQVQLVLNHNVPSHTKNYIHRVGRTARAGRRGKAVTLITPHDVNLIHAVEESIGMKLEEYEEIDDDAVAKIITQVGVTMREKDIRLSNEDFDEKRNINRRKRLILQGKDPDLEDERQRKYKATKIQLLRKSYNSKKSS